MQNKLILMVLITNQLFFAVAQAASGKQPSIRELQATLVAQDIGAFVRRVEAERWNPPTIYSQWCIDHVISKSEKPNAEVREFGKAIAIKIADASRQNQFSQSTKSAYQFSISLLDFADWLNRVEGYGNIILGARCLDVAAVGCGYCVIDPEFPKKDIASLLVRLRPHWLDPVIRMKILNEEAGVPIFSMGQTQDNSNLVEALSKIWQTGQAQALESRDPLLKARRIKQQAERNDPSKAQKIQPLQEPSYFDRPEILSNLSFFVDTPVIDSVSTVDVWDKKQHEKIIVALDSANVAKVEALAKFRERVGGFPTNFVVSHPFYTGGKAAFDLAWRPYATAETRLLYVIAWQAYDELKHGTFLDLETKLGRAFQPSKSKP